MTLLQKYEEKKEEGRLEAAAETYKELLRRGFSEEEAREIVKLPPDAIVDGTVQG